MPRKNLLVISNNFPNSDDTYTGEVFVKEQVKYLKDLFNTVYVISPVAYGIEKLRKTKYENYSFENVKVYFPKYFNFPVFYKYEREGWIYLAKNAIIYLIQHEGLKFDIIHAHFTWPSGALAVECKKKYKVPVVITEHTSVSFNRAINQRDYYSIKTWDSADAIIRVRKNDILLFSKIGINLEKIHYIPNGFDSHMFYPMDVDLCKKKLGIPTNKKIVLYVGNLYDKVKGHKYLIDAISQIVTNRKDILCVIVGAGYLWNTLECQIRSLCLEDYVMLVGGKPYCEIPIWMNACDLFVLPSLQESFGIVQIEAMACGKPVVATRNGGSEEIIISDTCGFLVEPANPMDLADKIRDAIDMEWDREAIHHYTEQFTWEKIVKEIADVYVQLF